jgi:hypothetical protein
LISFSGAILETDVIFSFTSGSFALFYREGFLTTSAYAEGDIFFLTSSIF